MAVRVERLQEMYARIVIEKHLALTSTSPGREVLQLLLAQAQELGPENDGLIAVYAREAAWALIDVEKELDDISRVRDHLQLLLNRFGAKTATALPDWCDSVDYLLNQGFKPVIAREEVKLEHI